MSHMFYKHNNLGYSEKQVLIQINQSCLPPSSGNCQEQGQREEHIAPQARMDQGTSKIPKSLWLYISRFPQGMNQSSQISGFFWLRPHVVLLIQPGWSHCPSPEPKHNPVAHLERIYCLKQQNWFSTASKCFFFNVPF